MERLEGFILFEIKKYMKKKESNIRFNDFEKGYYKAIFRLYEHYLIDEEM